MRTDAEILKTKNKIELILLQVSMDPFEVGYVLGMKHALEWFLDPDFVDLVDLALGGSQKDFT